MLLGSKLEEGLTLEQKATNADTWRHIWFVQRFINHTIKAFISDNAERHVNLIGLLKFMCLNEGNTPLAYEESLSKASDLKIICANTAALLKGVDGDTCQYIVGVLLDRCITHDQSKLVNPELDMFVEATPLLAKTVFGTPEYEEAKSKLGNALTHHYTHNRHHPEHFQRGVIDMTLIDVLEMLCDWMASSLRQPEGHILNSIDFCQGRFGFSEPVADLLRGTYHSYFIDEYLRDPSDYMSQKHDD